MKINRFIKILSFGVLLLFIAGLLLLIAASFCAPDLSKYESSGKMVFSKENNVIAYAPAPDTRYRFKTDSAKVDPLYLKMLIAAEDKRFYYHLGVDPIAILRAIVSNVVHDRRMSGASTLAMQVVRVNHPQSRTYINKIKEALGAIYLGVFTDKKTILDNYLTTAPFGAYIEGVTAASLFWFGHLPDKLTPAEAALLVALPRAPESMRPDKFYAKAKYYRNLVLKKAYKDGIIKKDIMQEATQESLPSSFKLPQQKAFHLGQWLFKRYPKQKVFYTTIDDKVQNKILDEIANFNITAPNDEDIAFVVIDNKDHSLAGYVGSRDFKRTQLDLTRAIRSPGSALKPFAYTLAFSQGKLHPQTIIEDKENDFGNYSPRNFTKEFQGQVTAEYALYTSLNLPALMVFKTIDPKFFLNTINQKHRNIILPKGAQANLPLILGGCGINLYDLTTLYSSLFNDGVYFEPKFLLSDNTTGEPFNLFEEKASRATFEILKKTTAPQAMLQNNKISYKTGTSYNFIDALALGSNDRYSAGVWIGNLQGKSIFPSTGYTKAAPILYSFLNTFIDDPIVKRPLSQKGPLSMEPPPSLKFLALESSLFQNLQVKGQEPLTITFPQNNSTVKTINNGLIYVFIEGGVPPYTLYVDDIEQNLNNCFTALQDGFYNLTVNDYIGNSTSIQIKVTN